MNDDERGFELPSLVIDNILVQGEFTACHAMQLASTCRQLHRAICKSTECVQFWSALLAKYCAMSECALPSNVVMPLKSRVAMFKTFGGPARQHLARKAQHPRDASEMLMFSSRFYVVGVTNDREIVDIVANLPQPAVALIRGVPHADTEFEELRLIDAITAEIDRRGIRLVGVFVSALLPESQLPAGGICVLLPRALEKISLMTQTSKCLIFYRPNLRLSDEQTTHLREAILSTWSRSSATRSLIFQPKFSAPLREHRPREAMMQHLMFVIFDTVLTPPPIDRTLICEVAMGGTMMTSFAWMPREPTPAIAVAVGINQDQDDNDDETEASTSASSSASTSTSRRTPILSLFRWRNAS